MSMSNFGLVECLPRRTLIQATEVLREIDEIREQKDQERIDQFRSKYSSFRYRFWFCNWRHWYNPVSEHELTADDVIELLKEQLGLFEDWKDKSQQNRYKKVEQVILLAEHSIHNDSKALYLNEYHIEALEDPNYWRPE